MKALLLLAFLLGSVIATTAAAVGAVEAPPQELQEGNQVSLVEQEVGVQIPEEEEPELFSAGKMASEVKDRFFACPSGWVRYKHSCYLYVSSSMSWSQALAYCNSLGATLPSVHDSFEYSFLQALSSRAGRSVAWIGGFYFQGWRWVDQSSFDYQYWSSQYSSSYPCIYLNARVGWTNYPCSYSLPSICKRSTDTC